MKIKMLNQLFFLLISLIIRYNALNAMEPSVINEHQKATLSLYSLRSMKNNNLIQFPKQPITKDFYTCNKCPERFALKTQLTKHQKQVHQKKQLNINKIYSCITCKQKFHNESLYIQHIKLHLPLELRIKNAILEEGVMVLVQKNNSLPTEFLPLEHLPFEMDLQ